MSGTSKAFLLAAAAASLSLRSASHLSNQHGRGLVVTPSGVVVMYVFSDWNGARGFGAIRWRPMKNWQRCY